MHTLYKPSVEELAPLREEALNHGRQTFEEWAEKMEKVLVSILSKRPLQYRSYGPYWWVVKRFLIERGEYRFGEFIDAEWLDRVDYGDTLNNIVAAYVFMQHAVTEGRIESNTHHIVLINEAGEFEDSMYTVIDDEMEAYGI